VHTEFGGGEEAEGKKPLGRPRSRWEGNIKMNFKEIKWKC
jgi:hypothetical protein